MLGALIKFFLHLWMADKFIKENSILGESRFDRESRKFWGTCGLILLLITAACGLAALWRG